jgi:hypothetical protein
MFKWFKKNFNWKNLEKEVNLNFITKELWWFDLDCNNDNNNNENNDNNNKEISPKKKKKKNENEKNTE